MPNRKTKARANRLVSDVGTAVGGAQSHNGGFGF